MSLGKHIAPHRLADAVSGRTSERESARIERHVTACARCASARDRLVSARAAMADIAEQPPPELGWDHIGVRVYWSTSSARHAALREKGRPWWRQAAVVPVAGALGLTAAAGFALTLWSAESRRAVDPPARPPVARTAPAAAPQAPVTPPLRGVVTFASGAVAIDGGAPRADVDVGALFASAIVEGAHLRTGEGRLVIQFGPTSGLALTPGSSVRLVRFDHRVVELVVDEGTVEVELARRRMDQTFSVVAGRHRVSVLGTAFQVGHRAGDLDVECARGQVVVSDGASQVAVSAGEHIQVMERSLLARALRQEIDRRRLAGLERGLARPLLPAWTESRALFDTSSTVELEAPTGRAVRVDGVEVGAGSFALRVMSGRHQLEVAGAGGGFANKAWIDAAPRDRREARADSSGIVRVLPAGATSDARAPGAGAGAVSAEQAAMRAARRLRRRQLERALEGGERALQCMRPLEKRDLVAGSYVVFDVGVNADGSQGHLNVVRSNVPPDAERCLRRVVDEVELPDGPQATVRFKLAF
ncbi:MAG TPA: FecR domain-containing protein [Kofleriaceae bacterium]|nr:FecR domain-containing protein [Kofleriaceae bacterium]